MNKSVKIICFFIMLATLLLLFSNFTYAATCTKCNGSAKIGGIPCPYCGGTGVVADAALELNPDNFKASDPTFSANSSLGKLSSKIIGTITTVGIIVSVTGVAILGIKYMTASVEAKADYKKTMIPILVGMIFIFLTSSIISMVYNIVSGMDTTPATSTQQEDEEKSEEQEKRDEQSAANDKEREDMEEAERRQQEEQQSQESSSQNKQPNKFDWDSIPSSAEEAEERRNDNMFDWDSIPSSAEEAEQRRREKINENLSFLTKL